MTPPRGRLGDHVDFSNGKSSPERDDDAPIPVYGSNGQIGFCEEANAPKETSVIGRVGSYCGSIHFSKNACWVTDNAIKATAKVPQESRFWFYAMANRDLHDLRAGSGQPLINQTSLKAVELPAPDAASRLEIANLLGALDDKIELNRRMSATLEEMARALYRSWFVDFDPVHARALGQPPAHMDATTADLFPDSFGPDGLPKGWEISSVDDIFDVVMGQSPPGNTYNDDNEGLPFFQGRTDFGFRYPENRKYCSAPSRIAEAESVLLSVRAPVGDINRAWERCCIGRGVASLSEKAGRTALGYYTMWSLSAELLSYDSEGTVFGAINKKQLLGLSSVAVPETLRDRFEEVAAPIDSRIRNLTDESRTLAALRDALLPRLMSGELRIREAEKQVEEVV